MMAFMKIQEKCDHSKNWDKNTKVLCHIVGNQFREQKSKVFEKIQKRLIEKRGLYMAFTHALLMWWENYQYNLYEHTYRRQINCIKLYECMFTICLSRFPDIVEELTVFFIIEKNNNRYMQQKL